jgi:hypothetical protein
MQTTFELETAYEDRRRLRALECAAIDVNTLHKCGCTESSKCACGCGDNVCENHQILIPGESGVWLPKCAKLYFDSVDAAEAEELAGMGAL